MKDEYIHGMDWTFEHKKGLSTLENYRDYQYNLVSEFFGSKILEVGSGDRGFTAEIFKNTPTWEKFISIEPSDGLFKQHQNTYNFPENIKFFNEDLFNISPDSFGKFDTIILFMC